MKKHPKFFHYIVYIERMQDVNETTVEIDKRDRTICGIVKESMDLIHELEKKIDIWPNCSMKRVHETWN